jgi:hypothetical protein
MDPLTIILVTAAFAALIGLAFLSGHELGRKNGLTAARICERNLADIRIKGLLERENRRAPRHGGTANEHPPFRHRPSRRTTLPAR